MISSVGIMGFNTSYGAGDNKIRVNHCSNAEPDVFIKWRNPDGSLRDTVTYKIVSEVRNLKSLFFQKVRAGLAEWSGFVYNIKEVGANDNADILVRLLDKTQLQRRVAGLVIPACDEGRILSVSMEIAVRSVYYKSKTL